MTETEQAMSKHKLACEAWCVTENLFQARVRKFSASKDGWIGIATATSLVGAINKAVKEAVRFLEFRAKATGGDS